MATVCPMPCAAPVTTATFTSKRPGWIMPVSCGKASCPGSRLRDPGPHRLLAAFGVLGENELRRAHVASLEGTDQVQVILGNLLARRQPRPQCLRHVLGDREPGIGIAE